jgi:hypothetical protein
MFDDIYQQHPTSSVQTARNNRNKYFESYASNHKKHELEKDFHFQKEMFDAMNNLDRYPGFKNKVWQQLNDFHQ